MWVEGAWTGRLTVKWICIFELQAKAEAAEKQEPEAPDSFQILNETLIDEIVVNSSKSELDFDLSSPISNLLDESDELDLLSEMMIQPSSTHFQHPRQPPSQNYGHAMNSYRQGGYHHPHHQVGALFWG